MMHSIEETTEDLYDDTDLDIVCEITTPLSHLHGYCEPNFDSVLCWPQTPPNTVAILPCFSQLNGIRYDTSRKYLNY